MKKTLSSAVGQLRMVTASVVTYFLKLLVAGASNGLGRVLAIYFVSRFVAAVTFSIVEQWSILDAYWWSGVASLTIGYGDFYPETVAGKLIADGFQLFWVVYITPAVIAHMVGLIIKNLHVFTHLEQEWLFNAITKCHELLLACLTLLVAIARNHGVEVPDKVNDLIRPLPPQPSDLEQEELVDEFDDASQAYAST